MALTQVNGGMLDSVAQQVGFRNRLINGAMMIDQRNAGASVTPTDGAFTVDRWQAWVSQPSKLTVQQSSTAPAGFAKSALITSSSAYTIGSTESFSFLQPIEGLNVADLAWGTASAASVTLSFQVRSSLTGTFGGFLRNNAGDRCYPFSFTISSANTFETKTVTIAGDTTGTWLTTNGVGVYVAFSMGAGSSKLGTAGAWGSTFYLGVTGQQNLVANNGATFYITGVQLEKGSTATSFDYRPYGTELALCQRYCYVVSGYSLGLTFGAGDSYAATMRFPVTMRSAPSLASGTFTPNTGSAGTVAIINSTQDQIRFYNSANNWTTNTPVTVSCTLPAEL